MKHNNQVLAYAKLVHHALNELWTDDVGCCPKCCAPCNALQMLDDEDVLDSIVQEWREYNDGTPVFHGEHPPWFVDGRVNRSWMYEQWVKGQDMECH